MLIAEDCFQGNSCNLRGIRSLQYSCQSSDCSCDVISIGMQQDRTCLIKIPGWWPWGRQRISKPRSGLWLLRGGPDGGCDHGFRALRCV